MQAARERIAAEGFSTSPREIEHRLALADEMRLVLEMERDFPGGKYPDVDRIVAKLRVEGSFLDVEESSPSEGALATIGGIVSFILNRAGAIRRSMPARGAWRPSGDRAAHRGDCRPIRQREGQRLSGTAWRFAGRSASARDRPPSGCRPLAAAKGAGDRREATPQISIRDGRAVIPVSASNKRKLNGFHPRRVGHRKDLLRQSRSRSWRSTTNCASWSMPNGARSCASSRSLPKRIRPDAELIAASGDYLAEMDMLRAKGRWASESDA